MSGSAFAASDGSFDSEAEEFIQEIDISSLPDNLLGIRYQDSSLEWGPVPAFRGV